MIVIAFTWNVPPWGHMSFCFGIQKWGTHTGLESGTPARLEYASSPGYQPHCGNLRGALYPYFYLVEILSLEEQEAVTRLVRLENRLIQAATHVLESMGYSPRPDDVRIVVEAFLLDFDSDTAFFTSLYRCLSNGAKVIFQVYPENNDQCELIMNAAMHVGFAGGIVVDFPHSKIMHSIVNLISY
ncbi:hypothetical protein RYX36_003604 [Vicia faba]